MASSQECFQQIMAFRTFQLFRGCQPWAGLWQIQEATFGYFNGADKTMCRYEYQETFSKFTSCDTPNELKPYQVAETSFQSFPHGY